MSTTIALTSMATTQAIIANGAAAEAGRQAHIAQCMVVMQKPDLETVTGRQSYASCVRFMEPIPSAPASTDTRMAVFALLVVCLIGGVIFMRRESCGDSWLDSAMMLLLGTFFTAAGLGLLIGAVALVMWCFGVSA